LAAASIALASVIVPLVTMSESQTAKRFFYVKIASSSDSKGASRQASTTTGRRSTGFARGFEGAVPRHPHGRTHAFDSFGPRDIHAAWMDSFQ
jgi:hypothetical protein